MKYVVFNLGCRVNQYEGQSMIERLIKRGHEATDKLEFADRYIINTCSITKTADRKSRQAVARVLSINPDAKVYICGCSSQQNPVAFSNKENVKTISGTRGKMQFLESVMSDMENGVSVSAPPRVYEDDLAPTVTKSRAYLKIQDGCDSFCSYCIVPFVRGRSRSRSLDSIVKEAMELADKTKEIVITGINVSMYGKEIGTDLVELVQALKPVKARKRFSSIECNAITPELLAAMKKSGFCDSFHLPLQSGSNEVLRMMNRHYTRELFLSKIKLIRKYFPDAGISSDILVGFPGESDQDFNDTVDIIIRSKFMDIHVFPYSPRPGTVASEMTQVEGRIVKYRCAMLKLLQEKMFKAFLDEQYGKISYVLTEEKKYGYTVGHSSNNIKVYTTGIVGIYEKFALTTPFKDGVLGEPINDLI